MEDIELDWEEGAAVDDANEEDGTALFPAVLTAACLADGAVVAVEAAVPEDAALRGGGGSSSSEESCAS